MLNEMSAGKTRGKRKNPEQEHQITYFQILAANEKKFPVVRWIHASMNGASASSTASAGLRKMLGQKAGVADVFIPVPMKGFHGCWIELKIKPNTLSAEQREFLSDMKDQGYYVKAAWSCDEMLDITEMYLGIKLNR